MLDEEKEGFFVKYDWVKSWSVGEVLSCSAARVGAVDAFLLRCQTSDAGRPKCGRTVERCGLCNRSWVVDNAIHDNYDK